MSLLAELNTIITNLGLSVETGVFSGVPPDEYIVLTPLIDNFPLFADNAPQCETQEVRVSIFSKGNYRQRSRQLTAAILAADITVTERRYVGYEADTKYHNYCVDTAKEYELQED